MDASMPTVLEILMRRKRLTQIELGRQIGLDQAVISQIKLRYRKPKPEHAQKIAAALGLSNPELLQEEWTPEIDAQLSN